ncbi:MAG: 4-(cytidine 5'-diphospho)-2-C-methyl-D-erythritol kinase [Longimicrobiales bacterium]
MREGARYELEAPAKVNLWLDVLAREETGFHAIETLFCALTLSDSLELTTLARSGLELEVEWANADPQGSGLEWTHGGSDDLVLRAARAFADASGLEPHWAFRLRKRIPIGAGLGGGSSDAAAALALLNHAARRALDPDALVRLAASLGSDVPFFLIGSPLGLGRGRGDRLLPLTPPPTRPVLVCMPRFTISTADAYRRLDDSRSAGATSVTRRPEADPATLSDWRTLAARSRNDFEAIIFALHPVLADLRRSLERAGAILARLSGSGAAVFATFETEDARDRAATRVTDAGFEGSVYHVATRADVPRIAERTSASA